MKHQQQEVVVLLASNYDQSRFLKAADLAREKKFRIKEVTEEEIGQDRDKTKKLVVWFTNDRRGLVLNVTNNRTVRGAYGDVCEEWTGKIIVVFPTQVDMRGRMTPALRVRIPAPRAAGNGQVAATPPPKLRKETPSSPVGADSELDEFGQSVSALSESDLEDETSF
jgi:hypothetical protein